MRSGNLLPCNHCRAQQKEESTSFPVSTQPILPWWLRRWSTCLQCGRPGFEPWVGKIPWRKEWLPTPVFWPGEFHLQPWGCKELDTTEQLSFSLSEFLIFEECLEVWLVENSPLPLELQEGDTILMELILITCEWRVCGTNHFLTHAQLHVCAFYVIPKMKTFYQMFA